MGDSHKLVLAYVAPALGTVLANVMFSSPMPAVIGARKEGALGPLNPVPFPIIMANTLAWLVFAVTLQDWFILWANLPGFIMGSFYSITCFSRAEPSVRFKEELTYMGFLLGVTCPILFTAMFGPDRSEMRVSSGFTANACLFLYYASPLSTIAEVIRTKSAETLYWPMVLANGINGGSWTAYGAFLREPFVFVPNGAGALLAIIQLLLVCVYGTKPPLGRRSNPSDTNSDSEGDVALKGVAASDAQTEWMSEVEDFP